MHTTSKTLYITDLDGTLLHHNEKISKESCEILNGLIKNGLNFSYATARSIVTSSKVSEGLEVELPVIVNNGTFITDFHTRERIISNKFTENEAADIYSSLINFEISPLIYSYINDNEKFSYEKSSINPALADFIESRKNDGRDNPLENTSHILDGDVFYFACIGEDEKLIAAYNALKEKYNCIYQKDIYSNEPWLEIMPHSATKALAILQLKELYGFDRVVVFGDGVNDIPMFEIADECYAVANATEKLKAIATDIIDSNENDGVAKWLTKNFKPSF